MSDNQSNRRESTNNNNGRNVLRQRLQRGAKDKVYAERLAAEKVVVGTSTAIISSALESRANHAGGGDEGTQEQQQSVQQHKQQRQLISSKKSRPSRERVARIPIPPGWPFTSLNSTTATTTASAVGNGGNKRGKKRKSAVSTTADNDDDSSLKPRGRMKNDKNNTLPPSSSSSSSSTSSSALTTKKRQQGQRQHSVAMYTPPIVEGTPMQKKELKQTHHHGGNTSTTSCTLSSNSNSTTASYSSTTTRRRRSRKSTEVNTTNNHSNNSNNKKKKNKWTCVRCTLLNTSRSKKCQACYTPRCYTTNDEDDVVDTNGNGSSFSLVDTAATTTAVNETLEFMVTTTTTTTTKKGMEEDSTNSGEKRQNDDDEEKSNVDDTTDALLLQGKESSALPPSWSMHQHDNDDVYNTINRAGSLEYTMVNVSVTVSNTRVYDDGSTMETSGNDEKIEVAGTNPSLLAIVPTSIFCRGEVLTDVINHDDSDVVESEETSNVALDTAMANNEAAFETKEECALQHPESQSQSQTSVQSELSALIDACPTSSSFASPPTNKLPVNTLDGILPAKESAAVNERLEQQKEEEVMQQQQSLSQSSVQSEFSAMIDATVLPRKQVQQAQSEKKEGSASPLVIRQEQEQTRHSENDRLGDDPDQFHSNDDTIDVLPTQQLQDQDEQLTQPPSNFKQWLQNRKDSRREKKRRRKRSKSTTWTDSQGQHCNESDSSDTDGSDGGTDGSDGGYDYIGTNAEFTTVAVRLIGRDGECGNATTVDESNAASQQNVLSATVPISLFSRRGDKLNGDAMHEAVDALDKDNAGDCNHPCGVGDVVVQEHENKADTSARLAHEDMGGAIEQSTFRLKESDDDVELDVSESTVLLSKRPINNPEENHDLQEGFLPGSIIESTPIRNTNEHCPSTQGSSSVHSNFPMTQQLPNFDYFTQASIEFPVTQGEEKSSHYSGESTSQCERDHGVTLDISNGVKECTNGDIKEKKKTIATKEINQISDKILGKENVSIQTMQNDADSDGNYNVHYFEESGEAYNPPTSGLGFTSVGSGKMIAVDEDQLAKAAMVLADNTTQKTDVHEDDCDYDKEYEPYNPPTSGLGFTSVGSGKMIAVDEEQLVNAAKVLADNTTQNADENLDDRDYDKEYEPYNPPTSGLGFTSVGSGKMIAVDEDQLAKAAKVLADNTTQKTDVHEDDCDYDKEYEPYNPPTSGLGFTSVGSGKMIAVDEEQLVNAAKVLADNTTQNADENLDDRDYDKECEPYNPPTSCLGFTSVGSGKMIAVDEEQLVNAAKVLADNTTQKPNQNDDDTFLMSSFDDDDIRAGKNTQKVRFSLGGNTSSRPEAFEDSLIEDNFSSTMVPRVSTDGSIQPPLSPFNTIVSHERLPAGDFEFESKSSITCESKDQVNIVTGNKEKSADSRLFDGESNQSSSPYNSSANAYTPLNVVKGLDSFQSEIKSKRLFERTISSEKATRKNLNGDSLSSDISSSTKVTLRQLAKRCNMETEWDKCKDIGVSDVVLKLTSVNALKLRFGEEGLPSFFFGQRAAPGRNHIGSVDDIYKWLVDEGFDESLFTKKWVQNHYRWIVWKLGSMERRFPSQLSGRYLTYEHVLLQMKSRYDKELCNAKRPSVRKILNRDMSASAPIVLCVAQILRFRSKGSGQEKGKSTTTEEIRLELTDGWYGVPAVIDTILQTLVANEKIRVGSKLLICNAQLSGSDEGVDPLDECYSSEKRDCPLFLKITTNNTRLATWDAKLGFLSPRSSGITIKSLRDIYPGGGNIPSIDLVVCKRYPKMFLEQISTGEKQIPTTNHLTEGEEASRRSMYDLKQQRAGEKHAEAAHIECAKELDEDAPFEWKQMALSNSPEEYYEKLSSSEKKAVDDWNERRLVLLQSMVSKFIGDSLRNESAPERKSNPYVKTLVKTFHRDHTKVSTQASAELTVWRVSDEQFDLLKEGAVLRMKNLGVKEKNRDGLLQLRAGPETVMELLSDESKRQLARSGYEERRPKSLIKINLMSKNMETGRLSNEVDVVACVARTQQLDENSTAIYLTDETGLALKLTRNHSTDNTDPFQLGNAKSHLVVSFCNIQITAFDEIEQCATGTWGLFSCKAGRIDPRHQELDSWCRSQCGADAIDAVCSRLEAGIPVVGGLSNRHQISIGYILSVFGEGGCAGAQRIKAAIDYGETMPLIAEFPLHLIRHTLALLRCNELREHAQGADLSDIPSLDAYFLNNQKLLHFSCEVVSCYGGDSPTLRVMQVSLANVDALSRLLMTSKST